MLIAPEIVAHNKLTENVKTSKQNIDTCKCSLLIAPEIVAHNKLTENVKTSKQNIDTCK